MTWNKKHIEILINLNKDIRPSEAKIIDDGTALISSASALNAMQLATVELEKEVKELKQQLSTEKRFRLEDAANSNEHYSIMHQKFQDEVKELKEQIQSTRALISFCQCIFPKAHPSGFSDGFCDRCNKIIPTP